MSSERKIAANRTNARKSTGPRSSDGKLRACRNALRHGLATSIYQLPGGELRVTDAARELSRALGHKNILDSALVSAESTAELARIRKMRAAIFDAEPTTVTRIDEIVFAARKLERYERRALSRRKKALKALFTAMVSTRSAEK